ncbi:MAG: S8 family serine peptidase [Candidatus Hydrogenedentes bacterium]|nr:S8 family serine peptidase [Candidatus Hydrogenedentota bacterium]
MKNLLFSKSRHFAKPISMLIVLSVFAPASVAQQSGDGTRIRSAYEGEQRIIKIPDRVGVRFKEGVSAARKVEIANQHSRLLPFSGRIAAAAQADTSKQVFSTRAGADKAQLKDLMGNLRGQDDIDIAGSVYECEVGKEAILSDRIYVSFSDLIEQQVVDGLLQKYGLLVERILEHRNIGQVGYMTRLIDPDADAIEVSNAIFDEAATTAASPQFVPMYSVLATGVPNDPYYAGTAGATTDTPWCATGNVAHNDGCNLPSYAAGWGNNDPGQENRRITHVEDAWEHTVGNNSVIVAVLDTGVDETHPDFAGANKFVDGYDFVWDDDDPDDFNLAGHGTNSAGIVGAIRNNEIGVAGVAGGDYAVGNVGVKIMPVVAWDEYIGQPGDVAAAIDFAADPDNNPGTDDGATVITMSLGWYEVNDALIETVRDARASGVVLVAAAHNWDQPNPAYPGRLPEVICVGALNKCYPMKRKFGAFTGSPGSVEWSPGDCDCNCNPPQNNWGSNYGWQVDVMAPALGGRTTASRFAENGFRVTSTTSSPLYKYNFDYSKTSSATPQVAGVAALIISANKESAGTPLDPLEVQAMLQFSSRDMNYSETRTIADAGGGTFHEDDPFEEEATLGRDRYTGYGLLDAEAAVTLAKRNRFVVNRSDGLFLASFFSDGDFDDGYSYDNTTVEGDYADGIMVLRGNLYESQQGLTEQQNEKELVIKNSADSVVALIDGDGNMYLEGTLHEWPWTPGSPFPAPSNSAFKFETTDISTQSSAVFAYITDEGDLYLRGKAFLGENPDENAMKEYLAWDDDFEDLNGSGVRSGTTLSQQGWTVEAGTWKDNDTVQFWAELDESGFTPERTVQEDLRGYLQMTMDVASSGDYEIWLTPRRNLTSLAICSAHIDEYAFVNNGAGAHTSPDVELTGSPLGNADSYFYTTGTASGAQFDSFMAQEFWVDMHAAGSCGSAGSPSILGNINGPNYFMEGLVSGNSPKIKHGINLNIGEELMITFKYQLPELGKFKIILDDNNPNFSSTILAVEHFEVSGSDKATLSLDTHTAVDKSKTYTFSSDIGDSHKVYLRNAWWEITLRFVPQGGLTRVSVDWGIAHGGVHKFFGSKVSDTYAITSLTDFHLEIVAPTPNPGLCRFDEFLVVADDSAN